MYYIITPTKGLRVLAQQILFKKGYRWGISSTEVRIHEDTQTICIGTRSRRSLTSLDYGGEPARGYMRRERPGSKELNMSELNRLEGV